MSYKNKAALSFSVFLFCTILYGFFAGETPEGDETALGWVFLILGMVGWFYTFWAFGKHKNRNGWLTALLGLLNVLGLIILLLIPVKKSTEAPA